MANDPPSSRYRSLEPKSPIRGLSNWVGSGTIPLGLGSGTVSLPKRSGATAIATTPSGQPPRQTPVESPDAMICFDAFSSPRYVLGRIAGLN